MQERVKIVKTKNIYNGVKLLLCKQKLKNLVLIHNLVKFRINKCYGMLAETKLLKKQNKFSCLFQKLRDINCEVNALTELLLLEKKKFAIVEVLKEKCNKKMFKLTNHCQNMFNNLFLIRKEEIYEELFLFYLNQGDYLEV